MKTIYRKLMCRMGRHLGRCDRGAFRCDYCDYVDPYYPGSEW